MCLAWSLALLSSFLTVLICQYVHPNIQAKFIKINILCIHHVIKIGILWLLEMSNHAYFLLIDVDKINPLWYMGLMHPLRRFFCWVLHHLSEPSELFSMAWASLVFWQKKSAHVRSQLWHDTVTWTRSARKKWLKGDVKGTVPPSSVHIFTYWDL